jgi:hypothetical protein
MVPGLALAAVGIHAAIAYQLVRIFCGERVTG